MGQLFSKVFGKLFGKKEVRILMLGLNNAGKTSILYKLNLGEFIKVAPTTAFNVETVEHKNITFKVWDLAGQKNIRQFWHSYYKDTKAVIFVIDATDRARLSTAKEELVRLLEGEIIQEMGLTTTKNRQWAVYPCSAKTGAGVEEGMTWLADVLNQETK